MNLTKRPFANARVRRVGSMLVDITCKKFLFYDHAMTYTHARNVPPCRELFSLLTCWRFFSAAQIYCPQRYKTMLKWLDLSRNTMSRLLPKLTGLFYFTGNKTTVPTCPVAMEMSFNPLQPVQSYSTSGSSCQSPSKYKVPFFVDRMGPKYFEFTVNAHEASPGHHLQSQGYVENFRWV